MHTAEVENILRTVFLLYSGRASKAEEKDKGLFFTLQAHNRIT
jgi:hypothetical protein